MFGSTLITNTKKPIDISFDGYLIPSTQSIETFYKEDPEFGFLNSLNGVFSCVIRDVARDRLYFITDRHGFGHLYLTKSSKNWHWSTQIPELIQQSEICKKIDPFSVEQFLTIGHLLENRTLFSDIHLLPPATIRTIRLSDGEILSDREYWSWREIEPDPNPPSSKIVAAKAADLFQESVEAHLQDHQRTGIFLSGGLDSRAILAATLKAGHRAGTITYGGGASQDMRMGEGVARRAGVTHERVEITSRSWLEERSRGVWESGGQFNMLHMHGVEALGRMSAIADVHLSGFMGDTLFGGSYLRKRAWCDTPITLQIAADWFGCDPALIEGLEHVEEYPHIDAYLIRQRRRRFIMEGIRMAWRQIPQRLPFADNRLTEFIYRYPDLWRLNGHLYLQIIRSRFASSMKGIPWQRTDLPLSFPFFVHRAMMKGIGLKNRFFPPSGFTDYANWLREEPARNMIEESLLHGPKHYRAYVDEADVTNKLHQHMNGETHTEFLGRVWTLEIFLTRLSET